MPTKGEPMNEDTAATMRLIYDLLKYANTPGADWEFASVVGRALAASLPPDSGLFPPGYDPSSGPEYPGGGGDRG